MDEDESLQAKYRELQLENRRLRASNQQLSEENSTLRGKVNAISSDFMDRVLEQCKPNHDEIVKLQQQIQRYAETNAALRAQLDASEQEGTGLKVDGEQLVHCLGFIGKHQGGMPTGLKQGVSEAVKLLEPTKEQWENGVTKRKLYDLLLHAGCDASALGHLL